MQTRELLRGECSIAFIQFPKRRGGLELKKLLRLGRRVLRRLPRRHGYLPAPNPVSPFSPGRIPSAWGGRGYFTGGPVVKSLCFYCKDMGSIPGRETKIMHGQKITIISALVCL